MAMVRRCKFVTTRAKKRCTNNARPNKYYCELHKGLGQSQDPVKRAAQLANLKSNSGTRKKGDYPGIEPTALAERVAEISNHVPYRSDDGGVVEYLRLRVV